MNAPHCRVALRSLFVFLAHLALAQPAIAAWPAGDIPVPVDPRFEYLTACGDSRGGVFIFASLGSQPARLRAFHIDHDGVLDPSWPVNGATLLTQPASLQFATPIAIPDGATGAFALVRSDASGGGFSRCVHMLSSGALDPQWPDTGLAIGDDGSPGSSWLEPDQQGGLLVGWQDIVRLEWRVGSGIGSLNGYLLLDQRITRIDGQGHFVPGWGGRAGTRLRGVAAESLLFSFGTRRPMKIAGDGSGGAFVALADSSGGQDDRLVFHVGAGGATAAGWPAAGLVIGDARRTSSGGQDVLTGMIRDAGSGVYLAWTDSLGSAALAPRIQHLQSDGSVAPGWPANGLRPLFNGMPFTWMYGIAPDGSGGVLASVAEEALDLSGNIRVLRFDSNAQLHAGWPSGGIAIAAPDLAASRSGYIVAGGEMQPDPSGGAILFWGASGSDPYLRALRILANGSAPPNWSLGSPRSIALEASERVYADGLGGWIALSAHDGNLSTASAHVRQCIEDDIAAASVSIPALRDGIALRVGPVPSRGAVDLAITLRDPGTVALDIYSIDGRRVRSWRRSVPGGEERIRWDGLDDKGRRAEPGLYLATVRSGARSISGRLTLLR